MPNVQAGDLAVVWRSEAAPEVIGTFVRVIEPVVAGTTLPGAKLVFAAPTKPAWVVESLGRLLPRFNGAMVHVGDHAVSAAYDRNLRRLPRPDEMDDEDPRDVKRPVPEQLRTLIDLTVN